MASERYELNMSMKCVKYMIFVISITFAVVAAMLLSMAVAIGNLFDDFQNFIDSHFFVPPNLLIAIGIILLVIALFGCVGALKESTAMINIIFDSMGDYKQQDGYRNPIDTLQNTLECCGVDGFSDWAQFLPSDGTVMEYPETCCAAPPVNGECMPREYGCYSRLSWLISQGSVLIATGTVAVAFVQVLGAVCAFMLASAIRRAKTLRATRRWHLQQSLGIMTKPIETQYTGMEKSEANVDPDKYLPTSPSVN
uniref:Tetraspanin n=1 Tax=Anopheles melas TaxID=34690 RepID=A0A182U406_9DIPT